MKKVVYLISICLFAYVRSGISKSFETVWLKDVTTRFQTNKRTIIDLDLPNDLTFHLTRGSEILTLNLKRNHNINPNADEYFARKLKDGRPILVKSTNYEKENVAYYQDRENWSYMTVRCVKRSNKQCDRIINGNLRIGDRIYHVQPVENDVTSRNLVEDLGGLGKEYILKDQTHTQRPYSVTNKDKSRQLQSVYHVKVAFVIDSSAWEFYSSRVHGFNLLTKCRTTKREIKQIYSHIFNGMHLLYQGIEDPDISINIILAKFIFFKRYTDFPYNISGVVTFNKTNYINAKDYLFDIASWDRREGVKFHPEYDHGMFLTKYSLFLNSIESQLRDGGYLGGLAFIKTVCDVGVRNSVVVIHDLDLMVTSFAHELGHSLGAYHDGVKDAVDCRSEDLYIMSEDKELPDPRRPYSRNPWLFSNCSVRAFKQTLMNKQGFAGNISLGGKENLETVADVAWTPQVGVSIDRACVTIQGDYYDNLEYAQHIKTQLGEMIHANKQCELYYGKRSVVCETPIENICYFMKCTDPKSGICKTKYHIAARGTKCGTRKDQAP